MVKSFQTDQCLDLGRPINNIKTHSDDPAEIKFTFGELLMNAQTRGRGPRSAQKCPRINRPVYILTPTPDHT